MRIGCCASIEDAPAVNAAGFDFLEVNIQSVLCGETPDSDWNPPARSCPEIPIEVANCLIPGHLPVIGARRDMALLRGYMHRVASRAQRLGIDLLVFGSGQSRLRPDEMNAATANEQIADFLRMAGDICGDHNIDLAVEHLCRDETNTINTLSELRALVDQTNHPKVGALIDSYHFGVEGEFTSSIKTLEGHILHIHVAEPIGRGQPGSNGPIGQSKEGFDFEAYFKAIRNTGYQGRVSIEAIWSGEINACGEACVVEMRHAWGP